MSEQTKQFSQDFIQRHLDSLPDATSYEDDEIEHQIFEGFDSKAAERPTQLTVLYLVFKKNEAKDGWELSGYRY